MIQSLTNDLLTVEIASHGAELQNIVNNRTQYRYLWQGDKAFWGRRSPVLFPIVGSVWGGRFLMDGNVYPMSQHGFARDRDFKPVSDAPDGEAWFVLESDDDTLAVYPRRFRLEIGYSLHEARIGVMWRVTNLDRCPMQFQIGAHPAFNYPDFSAGDSVHGYFCFDSAGPLVSEVIDRNGCVGSETVSVDTDADGLLPVTASIFSRDALIFGSHQVHRVSMLDKNRAPYLTLLFQAPLVGLWSPSSDAPFACIEPWWGRCDRVGFEGDFSKREYVNTLAPGDTFSASYMIIIDNV